MACEDELLECNIKNFTPEQLFKMLLVKLPNGSAALRTCGCDCNGDPVILPISNSLFVNSLGDDLTAQREVFNLQFATLDAALVASQAGDTIYVFPGDYTATSPLHKDGVNWEFIGYPSVNVTAASAWSDGGQSTSINISGNAKINMVGFGAAIDITNPTTVVNANFFNVSGSGGQLIKLHNGSGTINIEKEAENGNVGGTISFLGNASYTVNCPDIICNTVVDNFTNYAVLMGDDVGGVYTGKSVINAKSIISGSQNVGATVLSSYAGHTGTLTINVSDRIFRGGLTTPYATSVSVCHFGGNLIINGKVDGGVGPALNYLADQVKSLKHNGEAENDGSFPVVFHRDVTASVTPSADNTTVVLNGIYRNSNERTIDFGNSNSHTLSGEVYNTYSGGSTAYGVFLESTTTTILFNLLKIVSSFGGATNYGIGSNTIGIKNIKIIHNVSSNVDTDGTINNLISGTNYVFDTDIE